MSKMKSARLLIMSALLVFVYAADEHDHGMLDVFDEILKKLNVTEAYLPKEKIDVFVNTVFRNFRCTAVGGTDCGQLMCFNTTDIITIVNGNVSVGIQEAEFEDLAVVLLYYIQNSAAFCRQQVDVTQYALNIYKTNFTQSLIAPALGNATNEEHLEEFIEVLNITYVPIEEEEEHAHEEGEVLVYEEECLAADYIINNLGNGAETVKEDHFQEVAALLIYHFFSSSTIKHKCRLLPTKTFFIDELFESFHSVNNTLSKEEFKELLTKLGISSSTTTEDAHIHEERKKRSIRSENVIKRSKRAADNHDDHGHATTKSCYSADQLLAVYDTTAPISKTAFTQLCPALIYQQTSDACKATDTHDDAKTPTEAERYGYSTLAVFIITLCALFGAILYPFSKNRCYEGFMAVFMGLAVGTLTSDALLHLIPEAFGIHKHSEDDGHDHGSGEIVVEPFVWYAFASIGSIYLFYIFETIFGMAGHSHTWPNDNHELEVGKEGTSNGKVEKAGTSNGGNWVNEPPKKNRSLNHLALMIIIGDGIHNFADGLAIAAAFTQSVAEGVGVSIAVFCHELPHELGDFAVLLQTKMRFRNAVFWNIASALTSFVGLYIGLNVASDPVARQWIFAATAGMFVYIALTDILPKLVHPPSMSIFIMTNVGILVGVTVMILLSIFEGHIKVT
ncbi:hypothetical protein SNE40_010936 [Patella caerulea]|uniref:Zinc transporter ZIP12 n=1 Tax=Patella caerulea TaxID=87958 RepID=A0AAN8JVD8_PATCE